jgi:hypothetical protein
MSWILLALLAASSLAADHPKNEPERSDPPRDKQLLEKARKTVLEMFQKDFDQATSPAKKKQLARELLENAPRIKEDLAVRYALLTEAKDQAIAAGQTALSLEAIDLTAKYFRVEPIAMKTAALEELSKSVRDPAGQRDIAVAALALCKTATEDNRFDDAQRLALVALIAARKSHSTQLVGQSNAALLEIMAAKKKAKK